MKIISGGQTGVDRAALDAALQHGIECGGWCPSGRLDEWGKIPDHYPVRELEQGSFAERTLQNVKDSDGTAIIHFGQLQGGTKHTLECCIAEARPYILIDGTKISAERAAKLIAQFVRKEKIKTLNIAGPRQSQVPGGYAYALCALKLFLVKLKAVTKKSYS